MKSLLFAPDSPFAASPACAPCPAEIVRRIMFQGRLYTVIIRDKLPIEAPLRTFIRAEAFSIQNDEPYVAHPIPRWTRDVLIKSNVVV